MDNLYHFRCPNGLELQVSSSPSPGLKCSFSKLRVDLNRPSVSIAVQDFWVRNPTTSWIFLLSQNECGVSLITMCRWSWRRENLGFSLRSMYTSPGWKIEIIEWNTCLSAQNMSIWCKNFHKNFGLKIRVMTLPPGPSLLALGSSISGSSLPILR